MDATTRFRENYQRDVNQDIKRKQFRAKRDAIWRSTQGYQIQRPKKTLSSGRIEQIEQFERALHWIVSNESFVTGRLSNGQRKTFKSKITTVVQAFERDLSKAVGITWSICRDYRLKIINNRLEERYRGIERIAKFIGYMQDIDDIRRYVHYEEETSRELRNTRKCFIGDIDVLYDGKIKKEAKEAKEAKNGIIEHLDWLQKTRNEGLKACPEKFERYVRGLSNIEWYFPDEEKISEKLLSIRECFYRDIGILDNGKTEEEREEAKDGIIEHLDWLQEKWDGRFQACAEKCERYVRGLSDIGWYPFDEKIHRELYNIRQYFHIDIKNVLDDKNTEEEREEAVGNIIEHLDWLQKTRNERFRAYAEDLRDRSRLVKECFDKYSHQLLGTRRRAELLRSFGRAYDEGRSYRQTTRGQDNSWMTSAYMQGTFDPNVREMEYRELELLDLIERERGIPSRSYSRHLKDLLTRAEACERRTSEQQSAGQDTFSTQFRYCYFWIMRAVHARLMLEHYLLPNESRVAFDRADLLVYDFERGMPVIILPPSSPNQGLMSPNTYDAWLLTLDRVERERQMR